MTKNELIEWIEAFKKTYAGFPKESEEACDAAISALEEIQQYREIGTVKKCRETAKKQRPMKVTDIHVDEYFCPACGAENCCDQGIVRDRYCPNCGQAILQENKDD